MEGLPKYTEKDISRSVYRYLIMYTNEETTKCYYTHWFEPENHFPDSGNMVVIDLVKNQYMTNGKDWLDIEEDHL
jgi:hypothetical protein